MRTVKELAKLLDAEVAERQKLLQEMVGTLYPTVVIGEILTIRAAADLLREDA